MKNQKEKNTEKCNIQREKKGNNNILKYKNPIVQVKVLKRPQRSWAKHRNNFSTYYSETPQHEVEPHSEKLYIYQKKI